MDLITLALAKSSADGIKEKFGSPLVASTVSDMVEQNRVYVYTGNETGYTNGNWYYYDGNNWVSGGVYNSVAVDTDDTLSVADKAADAKAVGDEITALRSDFEQFVPGLSDEAKVALLACFEHVAWTDAQGQDYYDALEDALYATDTIESLTATFDSGTNFVFTDDTLESIKPYLTVIATYANGTRKIISQYELTGTLTKGTSILTVTYREIETTVNVTGVVDFYDNYEWSFVESQPSLLTRITRAVFDKQLDGARRGILTTEADATNRVSFVVDKGLAPLVTETNFIAMPYYPIPIPSEATKATIQLSDTSLTGDVRIEEYIDNSEYSLYPYLQYQIASNVSYPLTINFVAKTNLFLTFNIRKEDPTQDITTLPEISIVFE